MKDLNKLDDKELLKVFDDLPPIELHELLMSKDKELLTRIVKLLNERKDNI